MLELLHGVADKSVLRRTKYKPMICQRTWHAKCVATNATCKERMLGKHMQAGLLVANLHGDMRVMTQDNAKTHLQHGRLNRLTVAPAAGTYYCQCMQHAPKVRL